MTISQTLVLYNESEKRRLEAFTTLARIMGAEIKEDKKITNHEVPDVKMNQGFQFKDPGAYNHLSKEEKEKLTGKMMTFWKKWDKKSTLTTCGKNRISTSLPPHLKE